MGFPRELPTVRIRGVQYYFDYKMRQLRNAENPHDFIDLSFGERDAIAETLELETASKHKP